jgi:hypothetical protein
MESMKTQKPRAKPTILKSAGRASSGRVEQLERDVSALKKQLKQLGKAQPLTVTIETLAPEPFILKRPLQIVVRPSDGEYIATYFDANLGMSGSTPEEAVEGLKMVIVDAFDLYESNESCLGPGPARQLAVLRESIQRRV